MPIEARPYMPLASRGFESGEETKSSPVWYAYTVPYAQGHESIPVSHDGALLREQWTLFGSYLLSLPAKGMDIGSWLGKNLPPLLVETHILPPHNEDTEDSRRSQSPSTSPKRSIVDILAEAPGQLAFKSSQEVDDYLEEERNSWHN